MKILSIETSCDDTCITIMEMHGTFSARGGSALSGKILANNSNSQIKTHIPFGGVYPMLAKREHIKNLPILLEKTLRETRPNQVKAKPVDLIAVTYGPGLEPALWTGITFAQELAKKWKVKVVQVNHMEGHILSVFGKDKGKFSIPKVKFPALALLVSGGHTELVLIKKWHNYEVVGKTLDDAAGEAFDKVARMLGLPYPGGPQISRLAEEGRAKEKPIFSGSLSPRARGALPLGPSACETPRKDCFSFALPRPMLYTKNFDFSFSGLKTAVLYLIKKIGTLNEETKSKIALEFENAVVETLIYKTKKAMEKYGAKTLIVAGGVAANKHLRNEMKKITTPSPSSTRRGGFQKIKLLFPTQALSGDNSIMIGIAGYLQYMKKKGKIGKARNIKADGNLKL